MAAFDRSCGARERWRLETEQRAMMRERRQWWEVTEYSHSSAAVKYDFKVAALNLSVLILCNFLLLLLHILESNITFFVLLDLLRNCY